MKILLAEDNVASRINLTRQLQKWGHEVTAVADGAEGWEAVGDTGGGIPEDKIKDIWEPFFTTKSVGEGTGLGLPTVLGIIESHNGLICVENKPEGGALFTITFPALSKEAPREVQTAHCG